MMVPAFAQAAPLARTVADVDILALAQGRIPGLRRVAATGGGELHGACPACGGTDRFVVNGTGGNDGRGLFWCRQCEVSGDAIALLQLLDGVPVADAFRSLGIGQVNPRSSTRWTPPALPSIPQEPVEPPPEAWRARALAVLYKAEAMLWSDEGSKVRAYLHSRGLTDATMSAARIGYIPKDSYDDRAKWGLGHEAGSYQQRLSLPRGILIPYWMDGNIWRLEMRRPVAADHVAIKDRKSVKIAGNDDIGPVLRVLCRLPYANAAQLARETGMSLAGVDAALAWLASEHLTDKPAKYVTVAGSANAVWGLETVDPARPGMLVEGVLNALTVQQEAGDLVNVAALGATTHGRRPRWVAPMMRWAGQLIALDADDDAAKGDAAARWWLDVLQPTALRWRPTAIDPNAMLMAGINVRAWVQLGAETVAALIQAQQEPTHNAASARACPRCGCVLAGIVELCPHCADPAPTWRTLDGESGVPETQTAPAPVPLPKAAPRPIPARGDSEGWWNELEAQIEQASSEVVELWDAYQAAYANRQPTAELVQDIKALGGTALFRAWTEYKTGLALRKSPLGV